MESKAKIPLEGWLRVAIQKTADMSKLNVQALVHLTSDPNLAVRNLESISLILVPRIAF